MQAVGCVEAEEAEVELRDARNNDLRGGGHSYAPIFAALCLAPCDMQSHGQRDALGYAVSRSPPSVPTLRRAASGSCIGLALCPRLAFQEILPSQSTALVLTIRQGHAIHSRTAQLLGPLSAGQLAEQEAHAVITHASRSSVHLPPSICRPH